VPSDFRLATAARPAIGSLQRVRVSPLAPLTVAPGAKPNDRSQWKARFGTRPIRAASPLRTAGALRMASCGGNRVRIFWSSPGLERGESFRDVGRPFRGRASGALRETLGMQIARSVLRREVSNETAPFDYQAPSTLREAIDLLASNPSVRRRRGTKPAAGSRLPPGEPRSCWSMPVTMIRS